MGRLNAGLIAAAMLAPWACASPGELGEPEGPASQAPAETSIESEERVRRYIAAMCTLDGDWAGRFERYNEAGVYSVSDIEADFKCFPDDDLLMETNTFLPEGGAVFPTLKVFFPTGGSSQMQMSYFYNDQEGVYFFTADSVDLQDEKTWTTIRQSVTDPEPTQGAPETSRYIHTRDGDALTMLRELKRSEAGDEWALSSKLILTRRRED